MAEELKACPFCGGDADTFGTFAQYVTCNSRSACCGKQIRTIAADWNHRAAPPAARDGEAELHAAHAALNDLGVPNTETNPPRLMSLAERLAFLRPVAHVEQEIATVTAELARERAAREAAEQALARAREALRRAHACATLRDDGTCDGCFISSALSVGSGEGEAKEEGGS